MQRDRLSRTINSAIVRQMSFWLLVPLFVLAGGAEADAQPATRMTANQAVDAVPFTPPARPVPTNDQARPLLLPSSAPNSLGVPNGMDVSSWTSPSGLTSSLKIMLLMTVLTLAPSILMMTTSFVRFIIVFGLLRQALGTQQLPPNQVLTSLSLFLTFLVMSPVWQESYEAGIRPFTSPEPGEPVLSEAEAFRRAVQPLRKFMADQIDLADNGDAVWMFLDYLRPPADSPRLATWVEPKSYDDVPLAALAPAYMLSELKVAFLIGFQIFLPFVIIDMVISSILISMGMMMLPPVMISLPFKLLLFVLMDGWFLTVGMLLTSVRPPL